MTKEDDRQLSGKDAEAWDEFLPEMQEMAKLISALAKRFEEKSDELPECSGTAWLSAARALLLTVGNMLRGDEHYCLRAVVMALAGSFSEELVGDEEAAMEAAEMLTGYAPGKSTEEVEEIFHKLYHGAIQHWLRKEDSFEEESNGLAVNRNLN